MAGLDGDGARLPLVLVDLGVHKLHNVRAHGCREHSGHVDASLGYSGHAKDLDDGRHFQMKKNVGVFPF